MLYEFQDDQGDCISENQNRDELMRDVRSYYKGLAIDEECGEYEISGIIVLYDQFQEEVWRSDRIYECGNVSCGFSKSPYQQSEFI
jgi:hypothetical protein